MVHLVYDGDHEQKSFALRANDATITSLAPVEAPPRKIRGLTTLLMWGHGNQGSICHMDSRALYRYLRAWKYKNKSLSVIELLTCDARHYWNDPNSQGSDRHTHSVVDGLRPLMRRPLSPLKNVTLKALPMSRHGSSQAASILLTQTNDGTWAYISA